MECYLGQIGEYINLTQSGRSLLYCLRMKDGMNRYFEEKNLIKIEEAKKMNHKIGDTLKVIKSDYPELRCYEGKEGKIINIHAHMYRLEGMADQHGVCAVWSEHEVELAKPKKYALYDEFLGRFAVDHFSDDISYFQKWLTQNAKPNHKYVLYEIGQNFPAKTKTEYVLEGM